MLHVTKNLRIMLKSLHFIVFFRNASAIITCDPSTKIRYGKTSDTRTTCEKYAGCWEDGYGCYFSLQNVGGFRMMMGEFPYANINETISNTDRQECGRECLKRATCHCFTYDSNDRSCKMMNEFCFKSNMVIGSNITYNKYASKDLICGYGDCYEGNLNWNYINIQACYDLCKLYSSCKIIGFSSAEHFLPQYSCMAKVNFCDFTSKQNAHMYSSMCIPGPAFPDWATNHYINRDEIIDDSETTCKSVDIKDGFNLKVPWPSIRYNQSDFYIEIFGKSMEKCMDAAKSLDVNGLTAFVVDEFEVHPRFTGLFKACKMVDGNDENYCKYFCSCEKDYCGAVHIKAFTNNSDQMSICKYKIINL